MSTTPHGWTSHGHYIPHQHQRLAERPAVARCGGVRLCKTCQAEAALAPPDIDTPATFIQCSSTHTEKYPEGHVAVFECDLPADHRAHRSLGEPAGNDFVWHDDPQQMRARLLEVMEDLNVDGWIAVPHPSSGEPTQQQIRPDDLADALLDALGVPRG